MARRPDHALKWLANRLDGKTPIDMAVPWFSYTAIEALEAYVRPDAKVFEWGAGGSTIFFASRGCFVTTVESDALWAQRVTDSLASLPANTRSHVTLDVIPAGPGNKVENSRYLERVLEGGPWDIVVIDGLERSFLGRMDCVSVLEKHRDVLHDRTCIVLDDAWRPEYSDAGMKLAGLRRTRLWGLGPSRWGVTATDFFF